MRAAMACLGRLNALGSHASHTSHQCSARREMTAVPSAAKKKGGGGGGGKEKQERADRLLTRLGYCPRAQAKQWVSRGRVTLEGIPLTRADEKVPVLDILIDNEPPEHPHGQGGPKQMGGLRHPRKKKTFTIRAPKQTTNTAAPTSSTIASSTFQDLHLTSRACICVLYEAVSVMCVVPSSRASRRHA